VDLRKNRLRRGRRRSKSRHLVYSVYNKRQRSEQRILPDRRSQLHPRRHPEEDPTRQGKGSPRRLRPAQIQSQRVHRRSSGAQIGVSEALQPVYKGLERLYRGCIGSEAGSWLPTLICDAEPGPRTPDPQDPDSSLARPGPVRGSSLGRPGPTSLALRILKSAQNPENTEKPGGPENPSKNGFWIPQKTPFFIHKCSWRTGGPYSKENTI